MVVEELDTDENVKEIDLTLPVEITDEADDISKELKDISKGIDIKEANGVIDEIIAMRDNADKEGNHDLRDNLDEIIESMNGLSFLDSLIDPNPTLKVTNMLLKREERKALSKLDRNKRYQFVSEWAYFKDGMDKHLEDDLQLDKDKTMKFYYIIYNFINTKPIYHNVILIQQIINFLINIKFKPKDDDLSALRTKIESL